jgi:hypothetical protein
VGSGLAVVVPAAEEVVGATTLVVVLRVVGRTLVVE